MGQGLAQEAPAQGFVFVVHAGLVEEAVEGAPVVVVGKAQGHKGLRDGAPGEGEEVTEDEGLRAEEGALLAEGASVGDEQMP